MSQTVIGIFESSNEAQEAKSELLSSGFTNENVDINTSGSSTSTEYDSTTRKEEEGIGDRISHFFTNLFDSKEDADSHIKAARKGTTVVVHTRSKEETSQAVRILDEYGAMDVNEYAEKATNVSNDGVGKAMASTDGVGETIPVIKEELQVGKRDVETGGVRLRSRIVERPVEENIRLREEHVNVERTPVNRAATEADFTGFKEGTVEVIEHAEKPVVAKEAHVVEEVSLDKQVTERQETIADTVRHTEVETEQIPANENKYPDNSAYEPGKN